MERKVGLWIDHRKAVVVTLTEDKETVEEIKSGIKKHVRFSGENIAGEDTRDRKFENSLTKYFRKVSHHLEGADSIQIFGPGEARKELEVVLADQGLGSRISANEPADKMTNNQIVAKVKTHFNK